MTTALDGGEGSASHPGRFLPPGKTWYPLYRRLGGPQGRSGQMRKISQADSSLSQMTVTINGGFVGVQTECSSNKSHKLAVIRPVVLGV